MNSAADAKGIDLKMFGKWTWKQLLGVAAALATAVALTLFGVGTSCMCLGALLIAVILYMLPRMLGVENIKLMAVVGVVFVALTVLIGSLVIAPGFVEDRQGEPDISNNDYFAAVHYEYPGDGIQITATLKEKDGLDLGLIEVIFQHGVVSGIGLGGTVNGTMNSDIVLTLSGTDVSGFVPLDSGSLYIAGLVIKDVSSSNIEDHKYIEGSRTPSSFLTDAFEGSLTTLTLIGTFMSVIIIAVMFFILMIFSNLMRSRMEKTRAQMEKDGRLYPQGMGKCENCGAIVLPGEVTCRKCGTYIERPDELKPDKKDFFECSECGSEVPADAHQCPKCGAAFDEEDEVVPIEGDAVEVPTEKTEPASKSESSGREPIVCPECGDTSPAGAWFCPRCGRSFEKK